MEGELDVHIQMSSNWGAPNWNLEFIYRTTSKQGTNERKLLEDYITQSMECLRNRNLVLQSPCRGNRKELSYLMPIGTVTHEGNFNKGRPICSSKYRLRQWKQRPWKVCWCCWWDLWLFGTQDGEEEVIGGQGGPAVIQIACKVGTPLRASLARASWSSKESVIFQWHKKTGYERRLAVFQDSPSLSTSK